MINHVRTLLRNQDGQGPPTADAEEFTPPDYTRVLLPPYLNTLRTVLFGGDPDAAMLNYRLRQYMELLHSTELAEFVYSVDTRVTYLPFAATSDFDPNVNVTALGGDATLYLTGTLERTAGAALRYQWHVLAAPVYTEIQA